MNRIVSLAVLIFFLLSLSACGEKGGKSSKESTYSDFYGIAKIAPGWRGEIIAKTDQSYVGFDVEIGDADNDGKNEILTVSSPGSNLYRVKKVGSEWRTDLLANNLSAFNPSFGLAVEIDDLNADLKNEIIIGTASEGVVNVPLPNPFIYIFQVELNRLVIDLSFQTDPSFLNSRYPHGLAIHDVDNDGVKEIISAYCYRGEVIRFDVDKALTRVKARKIHHVSSSGEGSVIADIDNDNNPEYIVVSAFADKLAKIEIFEFDEKGELVHPPRIVIDGFEQKKYFHASVVAGDVDNDEKLELIVAWKHEEKSNIVTMLGYEIDEKAKHIYTFLSESSALDTGLLERAMVIADADNDGKNELLVSTVGNTQPKFYPTAFSERMGHLLMFKVDLQGNIRKELILDFDEAVASTSFIDVGDADNDGKNEIILATGKGERRELGTSYVVLLEKE